MTDEQLLRLHVLLGRLATTNGDKGKWLYRAYDLAVHGKEDVGEIPPIMVSQSGL